MKVIAFGEILFDQIGDKSFIGGAPLNFIANSVQCGAEGAIISAVGRDSLGSGVQSQLEKFKVSTQFLQTNMYPTGTVKVTLRNGQPSYEILENVAYDFIDVSILNTDELNNFDCFYFGTLAQRNSANQKNLKKILNNYNFNTVFLDVNLRQAFYNLAVLDYSISKCNILKINDEEISSVSKLLFGKALEENEFVSTTCNKYKSIDILIITKGAKGCSVWSNGECNDISSKKIEVKDTIGAGDAFSAAFLTRFYKTKDIKAAAQFANNIGAYVASCNGAIPKYNYKDYL